MDGFPNRRSSTRCPSFSYSLSPFNQNELTCTDSLQFKGSFTFSPSQTRAFSFLHHYLNASRPGFWQTLTVFIWRTAPLFTRWEARWGWWQAYPFWFFLCCYWNPRFWRKHNNDCASCQSQLIAELKSWKDKRYGKIGLNPEKCRREIFVKEPWWKLIA